MKTYLFAILALVVFQTQNSFAAMKDIVVDESRVSRLDTSTAETVIFGGSAACGTGDAGCTVSQYPADPLTLDGNFGECATPTNTSTCNSCTALTTTAGVYRACATRSVYGALPLRFTMTPDAISGSATVKAQLVVGSTTTTLSLVGSAPTAVNGQPFSIEILWNELCLKALNGACDASYGVTNSGDAFLATLYIGVSDSDLAGGNSAKFTVKFRRVNGATTALVAPNNCGSSDPFCSFKVAPGDEKVYIDDLIRGNTGTTDASQIKWSAVRVFHAVSECTPGASGTCGVGQPDFSTINIGTSGDYEDLTVTDKVQTATSLSSNKVTSNLKNDVSYKFTIATVDEATIVQGFSDPTLLNSTDNAATPGQVVGLLDDKKCFIATAAFGSPMEPQVQILRSFRNQFLLTNEFGRWFVKTYYKISPPIARFIAEHETLRAVVRWTLMPVITMAELMMDESQSSALGQEKP